VDHLLSPEEAAEALGCHRSFLFSLLATHELASLKLGRLRRIPASEIDRLIAARLHAERERQSQGPADNCATRRQPED
jgi:excisionase family DNA binding protein